MAVAGGGEITQFAGAIGESGEHGVAVRNGFVAGRFDTARKGFNGVDDFFLHDWESWCQFSMRGNWVGWSWDTDIRDQGSEIV